MKRVEKRDLTTGNVTSNLIYMAMPAIFGSLAQTIYTLVDMFWIGKISASAVAAVTISSSIFFLVWILSSIIGISSVSLISQQYGKKDIKGTEKAIEQTVVLKFIVAIITMVIMMFLLEPIVNFLTNDAVVIEKALEYSYIQLMFLPIFFSQATMTTALRCIGDSTKPMVIMMTAAVLNMVLDPILMFEVVPVVGIKGFGMGVAGAALATSLSSLVAFSIGMIVLFGGFTNVKPKLKGLFKLDKEVDKKLLTIGLPVGFEMTAREVGGLIVMKFLASYGTVVLAAVGITFRLVSFAYTIMSGLSSGGGAIVGQNLGANNVARAEDTAYAAAKLGIMMIGSLTAIVMVAAPDIIKVFVEDPAVHSVGAVILRITMVGATIFSIALSLSCVFTGSGYNFPYMISSILAKWVIQIPFLYIAIRIYNLPYYVVPISYFLSDSVESLVLLTFFKKGVWKTFRVSEKKVEVAAD
ncbi:MAG: MATE family efflux transporter [Clostridia bacterium]